MNGAENEFRLCKVDDDSENASKSDLLQQLAAASFVRVT